MKTIKDVRNKYDKTGKKLKSGDLLLECSALYGGRGPNGDFYFMRFWFYYGQHGSLGYHYDRMGELNEFWHVCSMDSYIIDKKRLPKELLYAIKHGGRDFETLIICDDPYEMIDKSNWREKIITPSDFRRYKKRYKECEEVKRIWMAR